MSSSDASGPNENRRAPRRRRLLTGRLSYGNEAFTADCVIRDLSETGAWIAVTNSHLIPEHVTLIELKSFVAHDATVKWRRANLIGLSFDNTISLDDQSTMRNRVLRRLAMAATRGSGST